MDSNPRDDEAVTIATGLDAAHAHFIFALALPYNTSDKYLDWKNHGRNRADLQATFNAAWERAGDHDRPYLHTISDNFGLTIPTDADTGADED